MSILIFIIISIILYIYQCLNMKVLIKIYFQDSTLYLFGALGFVVVGVGMYFLLSKSEPEVEEKVAPNLDELHEKTEVNIL